MTDTEALAEPIVETLLAVERLIQAHDPTRGTLALRMDMGTVAGSWTPVGGTPVAFEDFMINLDEDAGLEAALMAAMQGGTALNYVPPQRWSDPS
jgi:hypothetical protein